MISLLSRLLPVAVGVCALAACTYVTPKDREAHFDQLDEDRDGAPKGGKNRDCDDHDATRFPDNPEIPYNGIDDDCDLIDLIDQDGDGYPGVIFAEYMAAYPDQTWPTGVKEGPFDCADDPALIPEAAEIYPENPNDPPYDGLDSDCSGNNDFDADGDGDMPHDIDGISTQALFAAYETMFGLTFTASFGDCDDFDASVSSLVATDERYDAIDANCSGDNDFDADGDGYMPDGYEASYAAFLEFYHEGFAPAEWGASAFGDCLDEARPDLPGVDPADVNPGMTEIWYDGVDGNCDGGNDFDQDGDTYIATADEGAFDKYLDDWGYSLQAGLGECDDLDPTINPGQLEIVGDAVDQDCDSGVDTTPFGYGSMVWSNPRPPKVVATTEHYLVVTGADEVAYGALSPDNVALTLAFDRASTVDVSYIGNPIIWQGPTPAQTLGQGIDAEARADQWWAAVVYDGGFVTSLVAVDYTWNPVMGIYDRGTLHHSDLSPYDSLDVDLNIDSLGIPWAWSVGFDVVHVLRGRAIGADQGDLIQGVSASSVFITDADNQNTGTGTICDGVTCETYEFTGNALALSTTQDWTSETIETADNNAGTVILANIGTGVTVDDGATSYLVADDEHAMSADASWRGNTLYLATVFDDGSGPQVRLYYGDPAAGALTTADFPVVDIGRNLTPTAVSILADADRIVLAIRADGDAGDDAIGWAFLGL